MWTSMTIDVGLTSLCKYLHCGCSPRLLLLRAYRAGTGQMGCNDALDRLADSLSPALVEARHSGIKSSEAFLARLMSAGMLAWPGLPEYRAGRRAWPPPAGLSHLRRIPQLVVPKAVLWLRIAGKQNSLCARQTTTEGEAALTRKGNQACQ